MKILAIGEEKRLDELAKKLNREFTAASAWPDAVNSFDVIADLQADERASIPLERVEEKTLLIFCAVKKSLAAILHSSSRKNLPVAGMNLLPTFIQRPVAEVSFFNEEGKQRFETMAKEISWEFQEVQDRAGMVSPRVIVMLINEACFTLQEGTAGLHDIDKGMKLGTAYPFGPLEWCDHIGIKDVYETLEAVWNDTHDPRYKICPLLKTKYLRAEPFYL